MTTDTDTVDIAEFQRMQRELARLTANDDQQAAKAQHLAELRTVSEQIKPAGEAGIRIARQQWRAELRRRASEQFAAEHHQVVARAEPGLAKLRAKAREVQRRRDEELARHRAAIAKINDESQGVADRVAAATPGPFDPPAWFRDDRLITDKIAEQFGMSEIPS